MKSFTKIALIFLCAALLSSCASLNMKATDKNQATAHLKVSSGQTVFVDFPTTTDEVVENGWTAADNKSLQDKIIKALKRRDVNAVSTQSDNSIRLQTRIFGYGKGSGLARAFATGTTLGASSFNGSVILTVNGENRELDLVKSGSSGGMLSMGDQTMENIEWFSESLVTKIME